VDMIINCRGDSRIAPKQKRHVCKQRIVVNSGMRESWNAKCDGVRSWRI